MDQGQIGQAGLTRVHWPSEAGIYANHFEARAQPTLSLPTSGARHFVTAQRPLPRGWAAAGRFGHGDVLLETRVGDGGSVSHIRPMLVARSALSGIAGHQSGRPLRTRSVLADAAGTDLALADPGA